MKVKDIKPMPKRWAVARKGYFKVIVVYFSKEQALKAIEGRPELEVREVLG